MDAIDIIKERIVDIDKHITTSKEFIRNGLDFDQYDKIEEFAIYLSRMNSTKQNLITIMEDIKGQ